MPDPSLWWIVKIMILVFGATSALCLPVAMLLCCVIAQWGKARLAQTAAKIIIGQERRDD